MNASILMQMGLYGIIANAHNNIATLDILAAVVIADTDAVAKHGSFAGDGLVRVLLLL